MFLGIGQIMGPIYGSWATEKIGFRQTCDTVALICLIFAIVYIVVTGCI